MYALKKNVIFNKNLSNEISIYLKRYENLNFYFCFNNKFFSNYKGKKLEIANWINGYPVNINSLSSYLKHIFLLSLIISSLSVVVLYKMLQRQESYRKKEITIDIASKIAHEVARPISKIQAISELVYNNINQLRVKEIKERMFQIKLLTNTHKDYLGTMFSSYLNNENKKINLSLDNVDIVKLVNTCINNSIMDKDIKFDVCINISDILHHNYVLIDENRFSICIQNLLTNSYEAIYQNFGNDYLLYKFKIIIDINYDKFENKLVIRVKNYGSYIEKNNLPLIFKPGISFKESNSGYGLSILKEYIELYDGCIDIESNLDSNDMKKSWVEFRIEFNNILYNSKINEISNKKNKNIISINREFKILVADDEVFFIDYFKNIFKDLPRIVQVDYTFDINSSLSLISKNYYDLCIIDLKFGQDRIAGLKLINTLKDFGSYILVHSSSNAKELLIPNSNHFYIIQKTVSKEEIFNIIYENYIKKYNLLKNEFENEININDIKNVIVIDDEHVLYKEWEELNPNINFKYFNYYDDFFDSIDNKKINLDSINIILTDFYFDKIKKGLTLLSNDDLGTLRDIYGYKRYVVLVSNAFLEDNEKIDAVIDKIPTKIDVLLKKLGR